MKGFPDGSIQAIVTDPPYLISFMGKKWDEEMEGGQALEWHIRWLTEAYRVLVPNGIIKVFSATRTFHRLAKAMRDVGFVDLSISAWCYGSGFPKSLNVSKAIDKSARAERDVIGYSRGVTVEDNQGFGGIARGGVGIVQKPAMIPVTALATDLAKEFDGYGTALKPAWEPFIVGRKPESGG